MSLMSRWSLALVTFVLAITSTSQATQPLPPDQIVEYTIRQNLADNSSPLLYVVRFYLVPAEARNNRIGWEVEQVRIVRMMVPGKKERDTALF